jgi:hypothetical protein
MGWRVPAVLFTIVVLFFLPMLLPSLWSRNTPVSWTRELVDWVAADLPDVELVVDARGTHMKATAAMPSLGLIAQVPLTRCLR